MLLMRVQQNLKLVSTIGLLLGTLVILTSVFLVANTVRLTIYARRLLIRTMKLVGANDAFIQRPFIVEGVVQGLLAALVALAVVTGAYSLIASYLETIGVQQHTTSQLVFLITGMMALGAMLGWVGSFLAARRFVKNVALH
jgi:cell division transport system permease protein